MRILVTLTLLLFELLTITAHAVPASELQNATVDVYQVQEAGKPKTTFVAPKPKKPTLREIVYYHIIERPYGGDVHLKRSSDPEPLQIEMDETMRPFTNGHGYQFADIELHETENHDTPPSFDAADNPTEEEEHPKSLPEEVTEAESSETTTMENLKSDETTEIPTEPGTEKEMTTEKPIVTTVSEEKKNRIRQRQFLFDRLKERYSANFKKPSTTTIGSTAAPSSTPTPVSTTVPAPAPARAKRGVNYEEIPLAPTLPPLDYSKYPGLRVYSGITPMYQTTIYPIEIEPSSEDDLKKAMKFKINDIFATMKPYDDDDRNNDNENKNDNKINKNNDNDGNKNENNGNKNGNNGNKNENNDDDIRVEKNNDGNDIRVDKHKPENKPKTYGMNLSEDQGVVWNNMWRPTNYHVGEPVKLYEVNEYEVSTITPVEKDDTPTETPATKPPSKKTTTTPNPKDTEDIYVEVKKHKHTTTTAKPKTEPKKEDTNEKKEKDNSSDEVKEGEDDNVAPKSLPKHKKKPNNTNQEKPNNEARPDLYEQLMNSDKFWKWLAHWTSNYMEVLSDRVKDMVKKEVAKEMKKYENAVQKVPLNQTKDESKPNNATAPVKDDKKANNSTNSEEVRNKEPVIKNNTLIVDGKEIPITNTTNFDKGNNDFLRRNRDENKRPNNNKLPTNDEKKTDHKNKTSSIEAQPNATKHEENTNNVKAQNVYGSATGNDKVTNIFIFYPGTDAEKIVDGLKPYLNNSVTGIAIKDDKKSDKDKKEEKVAEKPVDPTSSANKEPENVKTQKPIQNNDKTENNKPVDDKISTKLEANKEPNSNSTDAKNPDSQDKKDDETKKNNTEKVPEKIETPNVSPKSNSTTVNTEKNDDSKVSTSNLAPSNSTSTAPANANSTSVTPGANSTNITTNLTH